MIKTSKSPIWGPRSEPLFTTQPLHFWASQIQNSGCLLAPTPLLFAHPAFIEWRIPTSSLSPPPRSPHWFSFFGSAMPSWDSPTPLGTISTTISYHYAIFVHSLESGSATSNFIVKLLSEARMDVFYSKRVSERLGDNFFYTVIPALSPSYLSSL